MNASLGTQAMMKAAVEGWIRSKYIAPSYVFVFFGDDITKPHVANSLVIFRSVVGNNFVLRSRGRLLCCNSYEDILRLWA